LTGGFNATKVGEQLYNDFVIATSCAGLVGSPESVDCLRKLPIEELNAILVNSGDLTWPPVLDGDFFQDYATTQLNKGKFVQVPLLIGTNTDEGASFGFRFSSFTDTDDEFAAMLSRILLAENTNRTPEALAEELMELYPNDQTVGIPSIERWPHIIVSGDPIGEQYGTQVRRVSALIGDYQMHYPRRRANHAWAAHAVPSFAYRFNVVPNGVEDWQGSVHFQEVSDVASP
jgi:carboxylesterase type B